MRSARPTRWRRVLPWLLAAVAITALVIGAERSGGQGAGQRVAAIENQVRCPICGGETVAQSNTPIALAIRAQIKSEVHRGLGRTEIVDRLVSSYGANILESPQTSGISLLVWVLPGIAVAAALVLLFLVFRRWRPRGAAGISEEDRRLVASAIGRAGDDEVG